MAIDEKYESVQTIDIAGAAADLASGMTSRSIVQFFTTAQQAVHDKLAQADEQLAQDLSDLDVRLTAMINLVEQNNDKLGAGEEQQVVDLINQLMKDPTFVERLYVPLKTGERLELFDAVRVLAEDKIVKTGETIQRDDQTGYPTSYKVSTASGAEHTFAFGEPTVSEDGAKLLFTGAAQIRGLESVCEIEMQNNSRSHSIAGMTFQMRIYDILRIVHPQYKLSFELWGGDETVSEDNPVIGVNEGEEALGEDAGNDIPDPNSVPEGAFDSNPPEDEGAL